MPARLSYTGTEKWIEPCTIPYQTGEYAGLLKQLAEFAHPEIRQRIETIPLFHAACCVNDRSRL